jgi:hypothetical protein
METIHRQRVQCYLLLIAALSALNLDLYLLNVHTLALAATYKGLKEADARPRYQLRVSDMPPPSESFFARTLLSYVPDS